MRQVREKIGKVKEELLFILEKRGYLTKDETISEFIKILDILDEICEETSSATDPRLRSDK